MGEKGMIQLTFNPGLTLTDFEQPCPDFNKLT